MAWLGINNFYKDMQNHVWIQLFPTSYARGEITFGLELEPNPGLLASQETALTTRPCHLGPLELCFLPKDIIVNQHFSA